MGILSKKQKRKIAEEAFASITGTLRLYKIDYFSLPENLQNAIVAVFQQGSKQMGKELKKIYE